MIRSNSRPLGAITLREEILRDAVAWAVGTVSASEIDEINILNASILAMHRALDGLKVRPAFILVDGNRFKPYGATPFATIVKGDAKYLYHRSRKYLAKTFRDVRDAPFARAVSLVWLGS